MEFLYEAAEQDGYSYRAVKAWLAGQRHRVPASDHGGGEPFGTATVHLDPKDTTCGDTNRLATDCWISSGGSLLDGRAALVADYSRTAAPPVKWLGGEMRWLVPGEQVLGMLVFPIGRRLLGPFPFQLTRSPD